MATMRSTAALALLVVVSGSDVSPVQKVVELLEGCKAKVQKDLDAEAKEMEEYTAFCDDTIKDKAYAIKTAESQSVDLDADIEDATASIAELEDEIASLGNEIAGKEKELQEAMTVRKTAHEAFVASEKEMLASVDELMRAVSELKQGMALVQVDGKNSQRLEPALRALSQIVEAGSIDASSKKKLQSFLQAQQQGDGEDDDLALTGAPKAAAFASQSGGILTTIEDLQEKAEDTLSQLRKKETNEYHSFEMISSGLEGEVEHAKEKLASATNNKAGATEAKGKAESQLVEIKKTKAADEEYSATLSTECQQAAAAWEERLKSGKEEIGALDKAKEILLSGVKAFVQISARMARSSYDDDDDEKTSAARAQVTDLLRKLGREHHSFALAQLASMARSDPLAKIRSLVEDMIAKLLKEAEEEATHEAFCQEEMGKSKKSKEVKTAKSDKYQNRIDKAESTIALLTEGIKTLEAELAEIDRTQAEATAMRGEEKAAYDQASKDFRDSAEAVAKAIEVLKNYYEGTALAQVSSRTSAGGRAAQPSFGEAKSDTAHTIISVLEMSEEDFTRLLAETESEEEEAVHVYEKLTQENSVAKASKQAESKAKASEVKSLTVELENAKEDKASTDAELDAVLEYLQKLKPECETQAMSYAEKKAAREAEIAGLKEALSIISGEGLAFMQKGRRLRIGRRS